jgi:exosortase
LFARLHPWLVLLVLGYVWFRLVDHLRVEWSLNEQYSYGFAVPFLCAYLLYRRWSETPVSHQPSTILPSFRDFISPGILLLAFIATRWIEIANPDWRLVSWSMAIEVIAVSLLLMRLLLGPLALRQFAFPIVFFLVAVPWPTAAEQLIIQSLTRGIVAVTVEFLQLTGTAALAHGNVIETAGGFVDVDEACSGIRSFQAALMLALFFGEWHRFSLRRRLSLVGVALGLALLFNLARTLLLSSLAAHRGSQAIQQWHDPAGIAILVGCFTGIWLAATLLARRPASAPAPTRNPNPNPFRPLAPSWFSPFAFSMLLLIAAGELAIHFWYSSASRVPTAPWSITTPQHVTFTATELPKATKQILRYDESLTGTWNDAAVNRWQLIYLRWKPGRVAVHLARNHTPEICLPAAGRKLQHISDPMLVEVHGLTLPFRCFTTGAGLQPMFVFYSLWEDGASIQSTATDHLTWQRRFESVLQRRRNPGQRVIEIAITGPATREEAERLLRAELPRLISVR